MAAFLANTALALVLDTALFPTVGRFKATGFISADEERELGPSVLDPALSDSHVMRLKGHKRRHLRGMTVFKEDVC